MDFRVEFITARERRGIALIASTLLVLAVAAGFYMRPSQSHLGGQGSTVAKVTARPNHTPQIVLIPTVIVPADGKPTYWVAEGAGLPAGAVVVYPPTPP